MNRIFRDYVLKTKIALLIFAAAISGTSMASDRTDKIKAIMQAQGLAETLDQQISSARTASRQQGAQVLDQTLKGINPLKGLNPPDKILGDFAKAADEFIENIQPPWSTQEIVDIWSELYGAQFSDAELDQLLAHYLSPLGQKEVLVSRQAVIEFSQSFRSKYKPIAEAATAAYIKRLRAIIDDCKCPK